MHAFKILKKEKKKKEKNTNIVSCCCLFAIFGCLHVCLFLPVFLLVFFFFSHMSCLLSLFFLFSSLFTKQIDKIRTVTQQQQESS